MLDQFVARDRRREHLLRTACTLSIASPRKPTAA
jgi:hypothetical protein